MVTVSDRYGDLSIEDLIDDEIDGLDESPDGEIDFEGSFQRGEVRSFEADFGDELDETLARMEEIDPEWSDEFSAEVEAQEYFERHIEREVE